MKHVVIGAGPSGVIYALKVKHDNPKDTVIILESSDKVLKRILVSGNGRANFYNEELLNNSIEKAYENKCSALEIIDNNIALETLEFLKSLGLVYVIDNAGRFYPYSNSSLTLWKILVEALNKSNIEIKLNEKAVLVDSNKKHIKTQSGQTLTYDKLFIGVGGYSYDRVIGSNKNLLDSLNVKYSKFEPALCPLKTKEKIPAYLVGTRVYANVKLFEDNKLIYSEDGELLFKKDGVSGIAIFDASLFVDTNSNKNYKLSFDVTKRGDFVIDENKRNVPLDLIINEKLANYLNEKYGKKAFDKLSNIEFNVASKYDFKESQVSKGGVNLSEINLSNMSLKKDSNIYIGGEVIDLSAICGGYNIGLAFITAYKAAKNK